MTHKRSWPECLWGFYEWDYDAELKAQKERNYTTTPEERKLFRDKNKKYGDKIKNEIHP